MITLNAQFIEKLDEPDNLRAALQNAVRLEHATIPAYLYTLYSITPGTNTEIADLLRSVVLEEMTHMALVCNILNAIGGAPALSEPSFLPTYPGPLPGAVENDLIVPLKPFTLDLVENVFMVIEEPEYPLQFQAFVDAPQVTIGRFYTAIQTQLTTLGNSAYTGDPARQVTHDLGHNDLVPITDTQSAINAINTIVEQGEGTPTTPTDLQDQLAHYYRFAEIQHGRHLIPNPDSNPQTPPDQRYKYNGPLIPFDQTGVAPLPSNPTNLTYPADSAARRACNTFNYTYTGVLKSLHNAFNGHPADLANAIGLMESCKQQAMDMATIDSGLEDDTVTGPSFQYQPIN